VRRVGRRAVRSSPIVAAESSGPTLDTALSALDARFRTRLIKDYRDLKSAYVQRQFDACGLRAARFAETMLRLLQDRLAGTYIPFGTKIPNFIDECRKVENLPHAAGPEGLRVIMPRALAFMYTLRSKRGIGHVGGDVDANQIDAATAARIADWCMAELIRVVHTLSLEDAQRLLDAISARQLPHVWTVLGKRRVLDPSNNYREQTLLLLYETASGEVSADDLFKWTGHSHKTLYERDILGGLHRERLLEFDLERRTVVLSPTGSQLVEERLLSRAPGKW
jgi:hypothetical protein